MGGLKPRNFLLAVIAVQILAHLPVIDLPPMGQHTWRQTMGLTAARNYAQYGDSFWEPTQNVVESREDSGKAYFEFPLIYWLVGKSYQVTGFNHAAGRIAALAMGILFLTGAYALVSVLGFSDGFKKWYLFFLGFTPFFFYYSVSLLPNLPGLAFFLLGISAMIKGYREGCRPAPVLVGFALILLSTLLKASYLFYGLVLAFVVMHFFLESKRLKTLVYGALGGAIILIPNAWVYFHAKKLAVLSETRRPWIELSSKDFVWDVQSFFRIVKPMTTTWFLEMIVNTAAMPFFFAGLYLAFRKGGLFDRFNRIFWGAWFLSFGIFFLSFMVQFREHAYYQTSIIVLPAFFSAFAAQSLFAAGGRRILKGLAAFMLCATVVVSAGRVYKRWVYHKQVPDELLYRAEEFQKFIPEGELVLVTGDSSPLIYLYFLNRRGLVISSGTKTDAVSDFREKGFGYWVSDKPLTNYDFETGCGATRKIGNFNLCALR